jgi:hypothetical protein
LESGSGIYHIAGKIGSGKSTLMKFLCKDPRTPVYLKKWTESKRLIFAKFFFWRPGNRLQNSIKGLYRSILDEILAQCPDLLSMILPDLLGEETKTVTESSHKRNLDDDKIRNAFNRIINPPSCYEKYCFCFFIDGLDEFEETVEQDYIDLVSLLKQWVGSSDGIKTCLSSREYNVFSNSFDISRQIRLQDLTRDDIAAFTKSRLDLSDQFTAKSINDIVQSILSKADGVFLWVVLVVKSLRHSLSNGHRLSDLRRHLDTIPQNLTEMYTHLLDSIDESERYKSYCIFAVAIEMHKEDTNSISSLIYDWDCFRFSLFQYCFLEDLLDDTEFMKILCSKSFRIEKGKIQGLLQNASLTLNGRCQSLLEIKGDRNFPLGWRLPPLERYLTFTHRSTYEYFLSDGSNVLKKYKEGFSANTAIWQTKLAEIVRCDTQLVDEDLENFCTDLTWLIYGLQQDARFDLLDWLHAVVLQMQNMETRHIERRDTHIILIVGGSMARYTIGDGPEGIISVFHIAATLGCHEYILSKISADPQYLDHSLRASRLYRAIEIGATNCTEGLQLLRTFCQQYLPPNKILVFDPYIVSTDCLEYEQSGQESTTWVEFVHILAHQFEPDYTDMKERMRYTNAIEIFLNSGADPDIWLMLISETI